MDQAARTTRIEVHQVAERAYDPNVPARRPGGKPAKTPQYRVLVHKAYRSKYDELVKRVGLQAAQQFWDHLATSPGNPSPVAAITVLKGKVGKARDGWSKVYHYELSSMARAD